MKKTRLFTLLTLITLLFIFALFGCGKKEDAVLSVSLKNHDPNTVIETALGDFDYSQYTVIVTYESGNTEEITLSEEMIADTDLLKLYQVGDHEISINYGDQKYAFKVSIKRATFEDLKFPDNNVFTYDGKAHTVEVDGNIPANAIVTYIGGNSFINAGTYDVTAIISCEGYVTKKLTTTVTIERAKYDMSSVKFEGKEVVYDGTPHSIAISGTLPEGVSSPTYTIKEKITSSATDVGEYEVKATFNNNDPNYEPIPDMKAILKITPAEYIIRGVDIVFRSENGNVINDASMIYNGKSVTFDLNDYNKLSKRVSVSFSVFDRDGEKVSTSNINTGILNAGVYTVKAEFKLEDGNNYKPIEPIVRTFEVLKASHPPIENIQFTSVQTTYDGKEHSISITGNLPDGVTVTYEYYKDGVRVDDSNGNPMKAVIDVGSYIVKAVFKHENKNLGEIDNALAALNITKMTVNVSTVGFFGDRSIEYSGTPYEPTLTTWKNANETDYDILNYGPVKYYVLDSDSGQYIEMDKNERPTELGLYRVEIDISILDEYSDIYTFGDSDNVYTISKQFEIVKKEIDVPSIEFNGNSILEYTDAGHEITFESNADSSLMSVSMKYYKYDSGIYVAMNDGELPTDIGSYKAVVTATLKDTTHHFFTEETATAEFTFAFDIVAKQITANDIEL